MAATKAKEEELALVSCVYGDYLLSISPSGGPVRYLKCFLLPGNCFAGSRLCLASLIGRCFFVLIAGDVLTCQDDNH